MGLFRGKGCLYGCLGVFTAVIITGLGVVGFDLYKARESCIEYTVPLSQANETCKLIEYNITAPQQPEKIQELLARLKSLSQSPGNEVTLLASEVQLLINHIISRSLPDLATDGDLTIAQMGLFVHDFLPNPTASVSISKDAITLCAVSSINSSLLSWCPATGGRGVVAQATLTPSIAKPEQPLTITDAKLNGRKVQAAEFSSFQNGLYTILGAIDEDTNSSLLQTFISKIEKVTLEEDSLTLHPRRSPGNSGNAQ